MKLVNYRLVTHYLLLLALYSSRVSMVQKESKEMKVSGAVQDLLGLM